MAETYGIAVRLTKLEVAASLSAVEAVADSAPNGATPRTLVTAAQKLQHALDEFNESEDTRQEDEGEVESVDQRQRVDVYGTVTGNGTPVEDAVIRSLLIDDGKWLAQCDDNAAVVKWLRGAVQGAFQGKPLPLWTVGEIERALTSDGATMAALAAASLSAADLANVVRALLDFLAAAEVTR